MVTTSYKWRWGTIDSIDSGLCLILTMQFFDGLHFGKKNSKRCKMIQGLNMMNLAYSLPHCHLDIPAWNHHHCGIAVRNRNELGSSTVTPKSCVSPIQWTQPSICPGDEDTGAWDTHRYCLGHLREISVARGPGFCFLCNFGMIQWSKWSQNPPWLGKLQVVLFVFCDPNPRGLDFAQSSRPNFP